MAPGDGEALILGQNDNQPTRQTSIVTDSGDPDLNDPAFFIWGEHGTGLRSVSQDENGVEGVSFGLTEEGTIGKSGVLGTTLPDPESGSEEAGPGIGVVGSSRI